MAKGRTASVRLLGKVGVLQDLPPDEVKALAAHIEESVFAAGAFLMREGEPGTAVYFLIEGKARIEKKGAGVIAHVGAGDVVGETAVLRGTPRTATVIAETDVKALSLTKDHFAGLMERAPALRTALGELSALRVSGHARP